MSMRIRGMQTKCLLPNSETALFSRDCDPYAHRVAGSLFAYRLRSLRDFRAILARFLDIIIMFAPS